MRRGLLVMAPLILVGIVGALVTIGAHQSNSAFVYEQVHPSNIGPEQLETILTQTREPTPDGHGSRAASARCLPGVNGPKLNPWHCVLEYASGDSITYRIVVQPSGEFSGADRTGTRLIHGCCVLGVRDPSS